MQNAVLGKVNYSKQILLMPNMWLDTNAMNISIDIQLSILETNVEW
jgi:hypothetical protein